MAGKDPAKWEPLEGMPEGAPRWGDPGLREMEREWQEIRGALQSKDRPRRFLDNWLRERRRGFAIETGQIENLYTLRRGVTEELVAEGLQSVMGAHTLEGLSDRTIQGLLRDQEEALDMMFKDVARGWPLTKHTIRTWHAKLTSHQETVTALSPRPDGKGLMRVQIPFKEKGVWKIIPNNPRRADGRVHEYCPPEQVESEMDRFIEFHRAIEERDYPVEVEAAWMHHRFVRTHPFRDGNGRVSRMLMAYAYTKRWLPPPIITAQGKSDYIDVLERADRGDFRAFCDLGGAGSERTVGCHSDRQGRAGRISGAPQRERRPDLRGPLRATPPGRRPGAAELGAESRSLGARSSKRAHRGSITAPRPSSALRGGSGRGRDPCRGRPARRRFSARSTGGRPNWGGPRRAGSRSSRKAAGSLGPRNYRIILASAGTGCAAIAESVARMVPMSQGCRISAA